MDCKRSPRKFGRLIAFVPCVALAMLFAGCGIVGGESPTPTPTLTSTPTHTSTPVPTRTPTSTPTPLPTDTPTPLPTDTPAPASAPQSSAPPPAARPPAGIPLPRGRTMVLRTSGGGAVSATVGFRGDLLAMLPDGAGGFWRTVGASAVAQLGDFPANYTLYDASGVAVGTRSELISVVYTEYPVEYITLPPGQLEGISSEQAVYEANTRASTFAQFTPEKLWSSGNFILPTAGPITAGYGDGRSYNGNPVSSYHSGTDFGGDLGAPVVAAARGRVAFVGTFASRGNSIIIDHGGGVFTGYHHLSRMDVGAGVEVAQGQLIGGIGATGLATGAHLHWELIVAGVNVDPMFWTYAGGAP